MVNFSPLTAEIDWLCGVEQRAPPTFGRAAIMLGIGPHSSFSFLSVAKSYPLQ